MPDRTADVITSVLATCAPDVAATRWPVAVHVQPHADLVGHGAGRDVERGLLAGELGGALLQPVHGRVVAVPVVADLGVGHRPAHGGRRRGDGVRTEVDPVGSHGAASVQEHRLAVDVADLRQVGLRSYSASTSTRFTPWRVTPSGTFA